MRYAITYEATMRIILNANNKEDAEQKFLNLEFEDDQESIEVLDQDIVDVEELSN